MITDLSKKIRFIYFSIHTIEPLNCAESYAIVEFLHLGKVYFVMFVT